MARERAGKHAPRRLRALSSGGGEDGDQGGGARGGAAAALFPGRRSRGHN